MWKYRLICWLLRRISRDSADYIRRIRKLRQYAYNELIAVDEHWAVVTEILKRGYDQPNQALEIRDLAVVMQGPLHLDDDFTQETLRVYRQLFPGASLVLSTWTPINAAASRALMAIEKLGVQVVCQPPPEDMGPRNVNAHLVSTRTGIDVAAECQANYVLKCRSDARMQSPNIAEYLLGLLATFPPSGGDWGLRGRLVILDLYTRLYIPHHPSDMLMFGHLDDMRLFWSAPLDSGDVPEPRFRNMEDLIDRYPIPETYFCEHFLRKIGYPFKRDLESWWRVLTDLFVVADRSSLRYFWPKYGYVSDHRDRQDDESRNMALCSFRDWLRIYSGYAEPPIAYEDLLAQPVNALVNQTPAGANESRRVA